MAELGASGGYQYVHGWRNVVRYSFRLDYASGVPTIDKDNAGLIESVGDTATGKITVTFKDIWEEVYASVQGYGFTDDEDSCRLLSKTEGGSSGATLVIGVIDGSADSANGDLADLDCKIDVCVDLFRSAADS